MMIFFNYQSGSYQCSILVFEDFLFLEETDETVGGGDVVYTIKNEDETVRFKTFYFLSRTSFF